MMGRLVVLAAGIEIVAGLALLIAPAIGVKLLLGAEAGPAGLVMARFAGIGLLSLGIACLPGRQGSALFVFNAGVATLLALAALNDGPGGMLLWPLVVLHAVLALALGRGLLAARAATANAQGGNG